MAPRKRTSNPDLIDYPGLGCRSWGVYFIKHPTTGREASLETKDSTKAKQIYAILMTKWRSEMGEQTADALLNKLENLKEQQDYEVPTLAEYAKYWRIEWLGVEVIKQGKRTQYQHSECKAMSRKGKVLAKNTVKDYAGYIFNKYEPSPLFLKTLLCEPKISKVLRQFLSAWSKSPTTYNHHLACLSKIFQQAIKDGHVDQNPCRDIALAIIRKKTADEIEAQYITDDAYSRITQSMMVNEHNGKKYDGEWQARLVDLMLFMSSRPIDTIAVRDDNFDEHGNVTYQTTKTDQWIWVEDETGDLADIVLWFRNWKRANNIISPYLCVQPKYKRLGIAGTPVTVKYLSSQFSAAVVTAGFAKGQWTLRLVRHKGLTDEAMKDDANNKGGHRTESAKQNYRVKVIPTRTKNTLSNPRHALARLSNTD